MIKAVLAVMAGAAGALSAEKWFARTRMRFRPRAVTDSLLDRVNDRLERKRSSL